MRVFCALAQFGWRAVEGLDISPLDRFHWAPHYTMLAGMAGVEVLSKPQELFAFDFAQDARSCWQLNEPVALSVLVCVLMFLYIWVFPQVSVPRSLEWQTLCSFGSFAMALRCQAKKFQPASLSRSNASRNIQA
jgi:hypothetical protein